MRKQALRVLRQAARVLDLLDRRGGTILELSAAERRQLAKVAAHARPWLPETIVPKTVPPAVEHLVDPYPQPVAEARHG